jgi:hypothetical protein
MLRICVLYGRFRLDWRDRRSLGPVPQPHVHAPAYNVIFQAVSLSFSPLRLRKHKIIGSVWIDVPESFDDMLTDGMRAVNRPLVRSLLGMR